MFGKLIHIPIELYSIEEDGYHLSIPVRINGKKALMLIDTGASRTVFDQERIKRFTGEELMEPNDKLSTGLGTSTMKTHTIVLRKINIGNLLVSEFTTILLDLQHVNDSYTKLGLLPIDGVLGSDLLVKYQAVINYKNKKLSLRDTSLSKMKKNVQ
jgi:hypothetical protein